MPMLDDHCVTGAFALRRWRWRLACALLCSANGCYLGGPPPEKDATGGRSSTTGGRVSTGGRPATGGAPSGEGGTETGGTPSGEGGTGNVGGDEQGTGGSVLVPGLPCEIDALLGAYCASCHATAALEAGVQIATYEDLVRPAVSLPSLTEAEYALLRMKSTEIPMPPSGDAVPADEIALFEAWLDDGMPDTGCVLASKRRAP